MKNLKPAVVIMLSFFLMVSCKLPEYFVKTPTEEPGQVEPTPTHSPEQKATATQTDTPTPVTSLEKTPTQPADLPSAAASLLQEGPWWVFQTTVTLWAINADGSGLTPILDPASLNTEARSYRLAPSPAGDWLAFIEIELGNTQTPPRLELMHLPDGQLVPVANLHPAVAVDRDDVDAYDRWLATGLQNTLSWSPDGTQLAFNAVIDGDSGDLYVYDLTTQLLTRLTEGPTESVFPVWSPDGRRIVHGAVMRLNLQMSGAGYDYTGVWSAKADNSGVDLLFETQTVGFERTIGWLSDSVVLIDTETPNDNPFCPYSELRSIDLDTREMQVFISGRYAARAFDPASKTVLLSISGDSGCEQDLVPGLYVLDIASELPPLPVVEDQPWEAEWSEEAGLFFASTDFGVMAVNASGQFIDLVKPEGAFGLPIAASGSRRLAWRGDALWIGTLQDNIDKLPQKIYTGRISEAAWSPDGQHLLFMDGKSLYVASEPDFEPQWIADIRGNSPAWVLSGGD